MRFFHSQSVFPLLPIIAIIALGVGLQTGCSSSSSPTDPTNPFAGAWQVAFAGDFTGGGTITIGTNGSFSENVVLNDGTQTFTNTISGTVSTSGTVMNGAIFFSPKLSD